MRVRDALGPAPLVVDPGASLAAVERLMADRGARHAAVVERGTLVGVVSTGVLAAAHPSCATSLTIGEVRHRLGDIAMRDIVRADPVVVSPVTPLIEAVRLLRELRVEVLAVCDEDRLLGLLTEADLLAVLEHAAAGPPPD